MYIHANEQEVLELGFGGYSSNWGIHICGLYQNEDERDEIIFGFLHQGNIQLDKQLYCPSERTKEDFIEKYSRLFPDNKNDLNNPELFSINSARELYYPDGIFSPIKMDEGLNKYFEESQRNGKRNIRATAEMVWALDKIPGVEYLMAYESRLNYFISGKPWISICLYNLNKFNGHIIMNVLRTHPFCIIGNVLHRSPYYIEPDEWLEKNCPEFKL